MSYKRKRITVKIGSNVLARPDGTLDITRMSALTDQIAELHKAGVEIIVISSGAVASGRSELKIPPQARRSFCQTIILGCGASQTHQSLLRAIQGTQYSLRTSAHDQRKFFDPATVPHTKTMYGGYA